MDELLSIEDLSVEFDTDDGVVHAVEHVGFSILPGQTVGLVGESGCGKSVTAMSIPRLVPRPPGRFMSGRILFNGKDLLAIPVEELRRLRGESISVIFQEPMTALSPLHKVRRQLAEMVLLHKSMPKKELDEFCAEWLKRVGIADPALCMEAYPYELSGGMRQRVMIAMALMLEPQLVIADEPTTALDVTIQAQILELMRNLKRRNPQSGLLLITHDMGVIWEMCDYVVVMYAGNVVEAAPVRELFANPRHPYTKGLMKSIPAIAQKAERLFSIPGTVPSLLNPPPGCRFAPRCPMAQDSCKKEGATRVAPVAQNGHFCACPLNES